MPRIRRSILESSVYLYQNRKDAEEGQRYGGSGFLLGVPSYGQDEVSPPSLDDRLASPEVYAAAHAAQPRHCKGVHFYIVTNRHVSRGTRIVRINTTAGGHRIMDLNSGLWVDHPNLDEVSVCPIPPLSRYTDQHVGIGIEMLLTQEMVAELGVGPGDQTFTVGRFVNHEGVQRNMPSLRFGYLSMMPLEPIRSKQPNDTILNLEDFLIEAYSVAGYSGSPVFLYVPKWELEHSEGNDLKRQSVVETIGNIWLLGVNWGHLPVTLNATTADGVKLEVCVNAGMQCVAPAWKILEVLNQPELVEQRRRERESWENLGAAILD